MFHSSHTFSYENMTSLFYGLMEKYERMDVLDVDEAKNPSGIRMVFLQN